MSDVPAGFRAEQRGAPHGFIADPDVFDTWFTSSLTPQINSHWASDPARHAKLFPADLRPQSHEIIRTWAFYTIAKSHLHAHTLPWKHLTVSGWILDPDRKKMSKSEGNVVTPTKLLEEHGADAVRYWAASARLGVDTTFDEKVFKVGRRLITKLYNAAKFVLAQSAADGTQSMDAELITHELDRAFIAELRTLIERASASFEEFEFAAALQQTESFFWTRFTDTYLELAKYRARGQAGDAAARASAVATLRQALGVFLRLLAPTLPYITEEIWSWAYATQETPSIHRARWPTVSELQAAASPARVDSLQIAINALTALHRVKTDHGASAGRAVESAELLMDSDTTAATLPVLSDVLAAARVAQHRLIESETAGIAVGELVFVPKACENTSS
jgi:valyl-tRNA synthetase